jgi:hypothetical protein
MRLVLVQTPPATRCSHDALRDSRVLEMKLGVSARAPVNVQATRRRRNDCLFFVWPGSRLGAVLGIAFEVKAVLIVPRSDVPISLHR